MRIKNKEIRRRRHRKEQKIKDAARELRLQFAGGAKPASADKPAKPKAPAKKAPSKAVEGAKAEKPKKPRATKPKAEAPAAEAAAE